MTYTAALAFAAQPLTLPFEERLAALDLSEIMAHVEEEYSLDQQTLNRAEDLYREFLRLINTHPAGKSVLVPPRIVDMVWHSHILATRRYASDCEQLFGRFIHHIPMAGDKSMVHLRESTLDYFNTLPAYRNITEADMRQLAHSGSW